MYGFRLPQDFLIGTAHSAFQSEGAWDKDGKSESIMESYHKKYAGTYGPHYTKEEGERLGRVPYSHFMPDKGCFFYDHYEEYIEDMKKTGQNTYRFSLSWVRIIPDGVGEVNPKGIEFYNKVINKLLECGITPFVDLYHWDMPQVLQDKGGFANPAFPEWFEAYAKVCFENFGDRVKFWSTFNESQVNIYSGYWIGTFPPLIKNRAVTVQAAHYSLLAHFRAVRLYKSMNLGGKIGAVNCTSAISPAEMTENDVLAAELGYEWSFGWYTGPMLEGAYPKAILDNCPDIVAMMPPHYQEDLEKYFVKMDFLGLNYYIATRARYNPDSPVRSSGAGNFYAAPGQKFAPYPAGLFDVVQFIDARYGRDVEIYITENGCAIPNRYNKELECDDEERITYLREHLRMVARLIKCGFNLKGYYYWNDADSYEIFIGDELRFGLTWVNHETGERCWKKSRYYFSEVCKTKMVN